MASVYQSSEITLRSRERERERVRKQVYVARWARDFVISERVALSSHPERLKRQTALSQPLAVHIETLSGEHLAFNSIDSKFHFDFSEILTLTTHFVRRVVHWNNSWHNARETNRTSYQSIGGVRKEFTRVSPSEFGEHYLCICVCDLAG